jgi:hypothetical protein
VYWDCWLRPSITTHGPNACMDRGTGLHGVEEYRNSSELFLISEIGILLAHGLDKIEILAGYFPITIIGLSWLE